MKLKYEEDPVYKLYKVLDHEIATKIAGNAVYKSIDPLLKCILENNGCKMAEGFEPGQSSYNFTDDDEYVIYFITRALGNDITEYYDFIYINGTKALIIFLDYFDIRSSLPEGDDPSSVLAREMGNSVYYDAIKKIVEVFYVTFFSLSKALTATSFMNAMMWNQSIIAIHILNKYLTVTPRDIPDMPTKQIKEILDGNISLQLYGIRIYNT